MNSWCERGHGEILKKKKNCFRSWVRQQEEIYNNNSNENKIRRHTTTIRKQKWCNNRVITCVIVCRADTIDDASNVKTSDCLKVSMIF